jgi:hypothetical protein
VNQYLAPALTRLGVLSSHPAAFVVLLWYVVAWLIFNPRSFDWQSVATVGTWLTTCSSSERSIATRRPFTPNLMSCSASKEERAPSSPCLIRKSPRPSCSIA